MQGHIVETRTDRIMLENILYITPEIDDGEPGMLYRFLDGSASFYGLPNDNDRDAMWENVMSTLEGNADFVKYGEVFINIAHLEESSIVLEGPESPAHLFVFRNNVVKLAIPYASIDLLREGHRRFKIEWELGKLSRLRSATPKLMH